MFENSSDYRFAARAFLHGRWQGAMVVTFFSSIITTAISVVMTFVTPSLYEELISFMSSQSPSVLQLAEGIWQATSTPLLICVLLIMLQLILGQALELGRLHYFQNMVSGKEASFRDLFSRFGIFFKGIGLRLLMYIKMMLWALPGMAVYAGVLLLLSTRQINSTDDIEIFLRLVMSVEFFGMLAMIVPAVIAYFRYCMAPYMMAQIPSAGIRACITKSKQLMNGRKKQYCFMLLGFVGWLLLIELASSFLAQISYPVYIVAYLFASLALSVYTEMAKTVFYVRLTGQLVMPSEKKIQNPNERE